MTNHFQNAVINLITNVLEPLYLSKTYTNLKSALALMQARVRRRWSPQQICQWLHRAHPEQPSLSAETVYQYLYALPRGTRKRELLAQLHRPRQQRRPKTHALQRRGQLPDRVSIHERPAEVDARLVPRRWEADLVMGAGNRPPAQATAGESAQDAHL